MDKIENISDIILNAGDIKLNMSKLRLLRDIKTVRSNKRSLVLDNFWKGFGMDPDREKIYLTSNKNDKYEVMVSDDCVELPDKSIAAVCIVKYVDGSNMDLLAGFYVKESESGFTFYLWNTSSKMPYYDYDVMLLYDLLPANYKCTECITKSNDFMNPPESVTNVTATIRSVDKMVHNYSAERIEKHIPNPDLIMSKTAGSTVSDTAVIVENLFWSLGLGITGTFKCRVMKYRDNFMITTIDQFHSEDGALYDLVYMSFYKKYSLIGVRYAPNGGVMFAKTFLWNTVNGCPISGGPEFVSLQTSEADIESFISFSHSLETPENYADNYDSVKMMKGWNREVVDLLSDKDKQIINNYIHEYSMTSLINCATKAELTEFINFAKGLAIDTGSRDIELNSAMYCRSLGLNSYGTIKMSAYINDDTVIIISKKFYKLNDKLDIRFNMLLCQSEVLIGLDLCEGEIYSDLLWNAENHNPVAFGPVTANLNVIDGRIQEFVKFSRQHNHRDVFPVDEFHTALRTMTNIAQESKRFNSKSSSMSVIDTIDNTLYGKMKPVQSDIYQKLILMTYRFENFPSMWEISKVANKIQNDAPIVPKMIHDLLYPCNITLVGEDLLFTDMLIHDFRVVVSRPFACVNKVARFVIAVNKDKNFKDIIHFGVEYTLNVNEGNFRYIYINNFNKGLQEHDGHITYLYERMSRELKNDNNLYKVEE